MNSRNQKVPLVMLHGLMGGTDNWSGILPHLNKGCRPMNVRLPFLDEGRSLKSIEDVTEFASRRIDESGIDRMVLMGNSIGGHIAVNLMPRYTDRVAGLILTASGGLFERGTARVGARPSRAWVKKKCCEVFHDPGHVTEAMVDNVFGMTDNREVGRSLVKLAKSAKRENVTERLGNIGCPTLLIWGKNDKITPPNVGEAFYQQIPNSELVWLDNCGHAPMMEHPEVFAFYVNRWWNKHICPSSRRRSDNFTVGGYSLNPA